jgi:hypothetical protein
MIISKKPPYATTKVDPERTQMEINKLLAAYGITRYQWDTDFAKNQVHLNLEVEAEINGVKKGIAISISPPTFAAKRKTWNPKTGYQTVWAPNWSQSYRLLYNWLKVKIESVAYGMTTIESEFLSQVLMKLPSGETRTVYEILQGSIATGQIALEDKSKTTPTVNAVEIVDAIEIEEEKN